MLSALGDRGGRRRTRSGWTAAKDYIADEQWNRAIAELQVVAADAADPNRDEALFWLAHSQHQTGDTSAALADGRPSRTALPDAAAGFARRDSLRVEIAQRLQRDDVLWVLAVPPATPMPPTASAPTPVASTPAPPAPTTIIVRVPPTRHDQASGDGADSVSATARLCPARTERAPRLIAPTPMTPMAWPEGLLPAGAEGVDTDLKIEALVGLLEAHSERVIPLLRDIALDTKNPAEARRAVFALAQSSSPAARSTVVEAARRGPNMVRIAAIREIGRFGGPAFTTTLRQAISRAGDNDAAVRDTAIVTPGAHGRARAAAACSTPRCLPPRDSPCSARSRRPRVMTS